MKIKTLIDTNDLLPYTSGGSYFRISDPAQEDIIVLKSETESCKKKRRINGGKD